MAGYRFQDGNHSLRLCTAYDSHKAARAAVAVLVGQERIYLTAAQTGFVYAQICTDVFRVDQILRGVRKLFPCPEIAEMLLVLAGKKLAVHTVVVGYALYAFRCRLNLLLLKKQQTRE